MTVSNTTVKLNYNGNGSNRTFALTFPLLSAAHLRIVVTDASGTETEINNNFSLNTALDTLTYPTVASGLTPLPTGSTLTLIRQTPLTQEIDLQSGGALDAEQLERGYDKLTYLLQEIKEQVARCIKYAVAQTDIHTAEQFLSDIQTAADNAATSATSAATAANNANTRATQAAASATAAAGSATTAGTYANAASSSANAALEYRNDASTYATLSQGYAVDAQNAKDDAVLAKNTAQGFKDTAQTAAASASASVATVAQYKEDAQAASDSAAEHKHAALSAKGGAELAQAAAEDAQAAAELAQAAAEDAQDAAETAAASVPHYKAGKNITIDADGTINAQGGGGGGSVDVDGSLDPDSHNPVANSAIYAALQGKQASLSAAQLNAANSGATATKVSGYDTHVANGDIHVTAAQKAEWSGKQDAINDLAIIRANAQAGAGAAEAAATYGDVVTHDASEFQAAGSYAPASHTHTKAQVTDMPTKLSAFTDDLGTNPTHSHSQYLTSVPVATQATAGIVKPDGITITAAADGTLSAVGGGSASLSATYDSTNKILTLE